MGVVRREAYEPVRTRKTPIVATMKSRGTARPTFAATPTPFSAIAAVGAMMPIERAIVSQKRSSRRSPGICGALMSDLP